MGIRYDFAKNETIFEFIGSDWCVFDCFWQKHFCDYDDGSYARNHVSTFDVLVKWYVQFLPVEVTLSFFDMIQLKKQVKNSNLNKKL